jgi:hypothetical protein
MVARTQAEQKAVWGLAEITNRPTRLTDLGPTTHVPARIRLILRTQCRDCLPAQKGLETTGDGQ